MKHVIIVIMTILSGCYAPSNTNYGFTEKELNDLEITTLTRQQKEAEQIGNRFVNKPVEKLLEVIPDIEAEQYLKDKFRYKIRYEVLTVPSEIIKDHRSKAFMNIYLFSDETGDIIHYKTERISY
ncbi:MAG: hypothetical protein OXD54_18805 [Candidatus Poribacteria bacterium]|nr:hypothetical protein [Candidatus Poribacteria bacterium]